MPKHQLAAIFLTFGPLVTEVGAQQISNPPAARSTVAPMTIDALTTRLRSLGAGDRSVIVHSASNLASIMTTSPGSPNDTLWSDMETVGWTKRVNAFADMPQEVAKLLRGFQLTESGAAAVKAALGKISASPR